MFKELTDIQLKKVTGGNIIGTKMGANHYKDIIDWINHIIGRRP